MLIKILFVLLFIVNQKIKKMSNYFNENPHNLELFLIGLPVVLTIILFVLNPFNLFYF